MRTAIAVLLLFAAACDHGDVAVRLGAPCECDAYPCYPSGCGGEAFCRGGTCTIECADDSACPDGSVCMGGGCKYPCDSADDCPSNLPLCANGGCYGGPLVTE